MAYQALYRKWRPKVFEDVVGLPAVTSTLKHEVASDRIGHAYLFTGSRGTGKTTCARILAKAINCEHPNGGDPCGVCPSCRRIEDGAAMDITEIDAASNNGVGDIRELRENTNFTPAELKYRVYIIDEVHMLSTAAFNALLKTLEEPPEFVVFILATTEVYQLPATILSRCQRFDFSRIPSEVIRDRIVYIAGEEKSAITRDAAEMIARISDGGLRDAVSLLDQCIAYGGEITAELVNKVAGMTSKDYLMDITEKIIGHDTEAAIGIIDSLYADSCDMEQLCKELISHFRDIMLLRVSQNTEKYIKADKDTVARLAELAGKFTLNGIIAVLERLQDTEKLMKFSSDRLVDMEICAVRLCEPSLDESAAALSSRIAALEAAVASGSITVQSVPQAVLSAPKKKQEPQKKETYTAADASPDPTLRPVREWSEIMEALKHKNPAAVPFLTTATAKYRGETIVLSQVNPFIADQLKTGTGSMKSSLEEAIAHVLGRQYPVFLSNDESEAVPQEKDPFDDILARATLAGIEIDEE